ncbi:MAG: hypothetical protein WC319_07760 [Candidatus Paceibacterota bacterium]|jgi:hypothetical protein
MQDGSNTLTPEKLQELATEAENERKAKENAKAKEIKIAEGQQKDARIRAAKAGVYEQSGTTTASGAVAQASKEMAESAEKVATSKIDEEISRYDQGLTAYMDDVRKQAATDPDGAIKRLSAGMSFLKREDVTLHYERTLASLEAKQALRDGLINDLMSEYGLGNGKFDLEYLKTRAGKMVGDKQNPNRAGMDKLINDGAQQVEMPQIPDDMNAYLAETVVGMLGDITMNSIAWATGGSTLVAAASVPSAGQQVAANVSAMMATDVKEHREKVEKIRLLNEELRIKHEGDVIAAMIDFDGKVDASEREYNRMKFEATGMEIANAFKVLGMQARADEFIANMGRFIDGVENEEEKINKSSKFEKSKFDTEWANRIKLAEINSANDLMMARAKADEARAKGRYVPYKDILGAMPIMIANGMPTAPRAFESMITWQENIEPTYNNIMNYNAGSSKGNDIYAKINGMPIDAKTKAQMTENILIAQTLGYKINNVTDATLVDIGSRRITTIPKGKGFEEGGDLIQKYFTPISERELSYHVGTMESMLRNLAASSNAQVINIKNSSSDNSTPANLSSFAETTEK